jgi:DNA-binding IclR family transcriptional regulator
VKDVRARKPKADAMTRPLTSVDNALRLLLTLHDGRPVRVTDAAQLLAVSRATAHRLLATLEGRRFVEQDPVTRAYLVGEALARNWLPATSDVANAIEPEMRALARKLGETILLAVLHGTTVTIADSVDGGRAQHGHTFVGTTFPAHFSAAGLALLAELPPSEVRRRYSAETLRRTAWRRTKILRESEATLRGRLLAELDVVRERGFATNFGSGNHATNAIACSLRLPHGMQPMAIVVNVASSRRGRRAVLAMAAAMRDAAAMARLRFTPTTRPDRKDVPE